MNSISKSLLYILKILSLAVILTSILNTVINDKHNSIVLILGFLFLFIASYLENKMK